jgi:hypothetical protein
LGQGSSQQALPYSMTMLLPKRALQGVLLQGSSAGGGRQR